MNGETELTPEEKMAFDRLPREAAPSELLEERIVRALRQDGTLGSRRGAVTAWWRGSASGRARPWLVAAASMAAALVLFGSGTVVGHWMGVRSAERLMAVAREQDAALAAERVQAAGTAYVRALVALQALQAQSTTDGRGGAGVSRTETIAQVQQGGEAAMSTLYAAALELSRLTPGDRDVVDILEVLENRRLAPADRKNGTTSQWY